MLSVAHRSCTLAGNEAIIQAMITPLLRHLYDRLAELRRSLNVFVATWETVLSSPKLPLFDFIKLSDPRTDCGENLETYL